MLSLFMFLLAAQPTAKSPEEITAKLCPPTETHKLDADEKQIVLAIAEHYRKYQWTRSDGFVEASVGRHTVRSRKSPSVFVERSVPLAPFFEHGMKVKLEAHGIEPALAAELLASTTAANRSYKSFDASDLPLVIFHCSDFVGLLGRQPPSGRDMTNVDTAISMSVPAFDKTRTHALVLSLNDLQWLMGHGIDQTELLLLTKNNDRWVLTWHTLIGGWAQRDTHETPVTQDDHAVFNAMVARLAATRVTGGRCIRVVNESRLHDAEEISITGKWTKRGGDIAEAFHDMLTRASEYIGGYKPPGRSELVSDDLLQGERDKRFGSCGAVVRLTLPGFSQSRETAVAMYGIGFLTGEGIEWGEGTMLLRRKGKSWLVTEDAYDREMVEMKRGAGRMPAPNERR